MDLPHKKNIFFTKVGLPAKSGVSGVVITVVPGVAGFATWSPNLDHIGNSTRGVKFAQELVEIYYFHTFDVDVLGKCVSSSSSKKLDPRAGKYDDRSIQVMLSQCLKFKSIDLLP